MTQKERIDLDSIFSRISLHTYVRILKHTLTFRKIPSNQRRTFFLDKDQPMIFQMFFLQIDTKNNPYSEVEYYVPLGHIASHGDPR